MARTVSTEHVPRTAVHAPLSKRQRGIRQFVSRDIGTFLISTDMHSYPSNIPNIPHTNMDYGLLSLGAPSQQLHQGDASHPLATSDYPYVGQMPAIYPFPATNMPLPNWQQRTPLPQNCLAPHPQSEDQTELGLLDPSLRATTSFYLPPEATTTSPLREPVDKSPQVTDLPPR
jgi:hypothetical protein